MKLDPSNTVCPECRGQLFWLDDEAACNDCGFSYSEEEAQEDLLDCPECASLEGWNERIGLCTACGYDDLIGKAPPGDDYVEPFGTTLHFDKDFDPGFEPIWDRIIVPEPPYEPWDKLVTKMSKWPFFRVYDTTTSKFFQGVRWLVKKMGGPDIKNAAAAFGPCVFIPKEQWQTKRGYMTLCHEAEHVKDFWKFLIVPFYLMQWILPVGPSGRALLEYRGYLATMKAELEVYGYIPEYLPGHIAKTLASKIYLWCFPWRKWMERHLVQKRLEYIAAANGCLGCGGVKFCTCKLQVAHQ